MIPKFRAWHKTWEEMGKVKRIRFDDDGNANNVLFKGKEFGVNAKINEFELMQSTGLKDKNGKEIFEGDIVRMRNPRDRRQIGMFQVVRVANSPMLGLLDKKLTTEIFNLYEHMRNYYEIIGNIYENQELLEVTE